MKTLEKMTPAELEREGFRALCERLGVAGAFRYLQQAGLTSGDYTREKEEYLRGLTLEQAVQDARRIENRWEQS